MMVAKPLVFIFLAVTAVTGMKLELNDVGAEGERAGGKSGNVASAGRKSGSSTCKRCVGDYGAGGRGSERENLDTVWYCFDCNCKNAADKIDPIEEGCDMRSPYKDTLNYQCAPGCPLAWVGDGQCDLACTHEDCGNGAKDDNGDCDFGDATDVSDFTFAHVGSFGYNPTATKLDGNVNIATCATSCSEDTKCAAFDYNYDDASCTTYVAWATWQAVPSAVKRFAYTKDACTTARGQVTMCEATTPEDVFASIDDSKDARKDALAAEIEAKQDANAASKKTNAARLATLAEANDDASSARAQARKKRARNIKNKQAAVENMRKEVLESLEEEGDVEEDALDAISDRKAAIVAKIKDHELAGKNNALVKISAVSDKLNTFNRAKAEKYNAAQLEKNELKNMKKDQKAVLDELRETRKAEQRAKKALSNKGYGAPTRSSAVSGSGTGNSGTAAVKTSGYEEWKAAQSGTGA